MNVTYIYHSSFLVETVSAYLLFDYFKGELPRMTPSKPIYVFASHRHEDHFSPAIFELSRQYPEVRYILSSDIWKKRVPADLLSDTVFLSPGQRQQIGSLKVETLMSTDEGVAFVVETDGKTIYHAGDLNDWTWVGEPEDNNAWMRKNYREQIGRLRNRRIYVAFVVLDPRQEMEFSAGLTWFFQNVNVGVVFPMHCWEDYSIIERYLALPESIPYREKVCSIAGSGQAFLIRDGA